MYVYINKCGQRNYSQASFWCSEQIYSQTPFQKACWRSLFPYTNVPLQVIYWVGVFVVGLLPTPQPHAKCVTSQSEGISCPEPIIVLVLTENSKECLFTMQYTVKCLWDHGQQNQMVFMWQSLQIISRRLSFDVKLDQMIGN